MEFDKSMKFIANNNLLHVRYNVENSNNILREMTIYEI
jgi:hypothetical protein